MYGSLHVNWDVGINTSEGTGHTQNLGAHCLSWVQLSHNLEWQLIPHFFFFTVVDRQGHFFYTLVMDSMLLLFSEQNLSHVEWYCQ